MAPIQTLELDLSKCFKGEQQLVTWDIAYRALCDPETASKSEALREFLEADETRQILSKPWKPFPCPSPQEKSKFESKTAPISVTPSQNGPYNLDEIKDDSLWLSNEAKISEYTALRLVIQEWQSRPTVQLLSGLTEEEALSVQDAAGLANMGASTFVSNSSIIATPRSSPHFDSADQRRLRIVDVYHSTCASILRVSQLLVSWGAAPSLRNQTMYGKDYHNVCDSWIEELGQAISLAQNNGPASASNAKALDGCLEAVKEKMEALESPYSWNVPESIFEAAVEKWITAQTTDLLHILHIALAHADLFTKGFVAAATIEDWLNFFASRGFFRDFSAVCAGQEPLVPVIQMLTTLVSLALLKVDLVMRDVESARVENWDPASYVLNSGIVSNITALFGEMALLGPSPASAPAFTWAILTFRLTSRATAEEQEREQLLENGSRASLPDASALEEAVLAITRLESHDAFNNTMPYQVLAESCSAAGVFTIINQLVDIGMSAFGTHVDRLSRDRLRLLFLQLLRAALGSGIVEYSPELIVSTHTILAGDRTFRNWTDQENQLHADPIVAFFLEDEHILRPLLLDEACFRYPYEMTPFLKFFSALTRGDKTIRDGVPTFVDSLRRTSRFMQRLPDGFKDYALTREEENANWVELTVNLPQFSYGTASSFRGQRRLLTSATSLYVDGCLEIPAGTEGMIVDDRAPPFVAVWSYQHSALSYLVHLLSTYPVGSNKVEYTSQQPASIENTMEIIGLFADLLHSSLQASTGICSKDLLEAMDIGADRSQDTVSIILSIFEEELLRLCQEPTNEGSLELLVNCTHFLEALIVIAPNRVWPWIARSRLLESEGNGGSLATILIGTEMVLGRYDFLIGCIRLYKSLVGDAIDRSVARKGPSKALTRFNSPTTSDSGTSDKIMSNILFTFGRTLASVYESSLSWKYTRIEHRPEINIGICEVFTTILDLAYGADDTPNLSSKITRLIAPTAEYITELYLTRSENDLPTNPILASLVLGADSDHPSLLTSSAALWKQQTRSTLAFADILVRVAMMLNKPWTHLEQQLFKATPLLARLYASSDRWKSPVVLLLQSLVRGALRVVESEDLEMTDKPSKKQAPFKQKHDPQEPPSLLGHLGPRTAKNFLSVLSQLDEPLRIVDIQTNVWNLLSAVVTCKQQWFSLYLLTGSTPRETLRTKLGTGTPPPSRNKALLSRALEALSSLALPDPGKGTGFPWPLFTAMLEFVSSAQNNWSWAMGDLRQHKAFIQQLLTFLKWMAKQPKHLRANSDILERTYQNRFASLACEVIAMYLHSSRQISDISPLKDVVPSLAYLEANALNLPSYNVSLHSNLKQNFEEHFPGVSLANIKRTTLYPETFGKNFFYNLELGQQLLGFDSKWSGPREGTGFASEVEKSNYNLGLVESQVQLLHSWKLLAVELSHVVGKDERLAKILIGLIKACMVANAQSNLPEVLFGQLMLLRADLAFALIRKLVEVKTQNPEARQLLTPIWNAIRASTPDFDNVFSGAEAHYYRSLLRILYLSLQFHLLEETDDNSKEAAFRSSFRGTLPTKSNTFVEPISNQLLEILADTVAKGFRSLANQLHNDPDSVSPSDFALLTALLQRIIAIPEMSKWQTQAALLFSNNNTIRYATSLFSWADKLAISRGGVDDPVYGELSLLFVLSLSSIEALAETMAVEGILSQLNTANIMNFYRRPGGMGPFDSPTRLYSIWTKGILPLCLNLLLSVGPPIAAEIASFLNQFQPQLLRASNALNSNPATTLRNPTKITLSTASETHSLALISAILDSVRKQGPKLGIQASEISILEWDRENVKEDIEGWMARKGALRERIVVADERDAEMFAKKKEGDFENELEERVLFELEAAGVCLGLGKAEGK